MIQIFEIETILDTPIRDTSSGERERVALIRMLVSRPRILFLDEPFSHLDQRMKDIVEKVFQSYIDEVHATVFAITHHPGDLFSHSRVLTLEDHFLSEK